MKMRMFSMLLALCLLLSTGVLAASPEAVTGSAQALETGMELTLVLHTATTNGKIAVSYPAELELLETQTGFGDEVLWDVDPAKPGELSLAWISAKDVPAETTALTLTLAGEPGRYTFQVTPQELQRSGMVLNDPAVLRAMEHSALEAPCYLPVRVKKNKDGETEISGSIATSAQLGKLGLYVEEQLRRMVRELSAGNIDADPWARSEQDSACTYCEFAPACHFENGRGGDHIEYIRATGAEQLWEHIDRTIGEGGKRDG